jgi:hypothetical protein
LADLFSQVRKRVQISKDSTPGETFYKINRNDDNLISNTSSFLFTETERRLLRQTMQVCARFHKCKDMHEDGMNG